MLAVTNVKYIALLQSVRGTHCDTAIIALFVSWQNVSNFYQAGMCFTFPDSFVTAWEQD